MSDKTISPDSVRSFYNQSEIQPEIYETPAESANKTDEPPRLRNSSRGDTKTFWPSTQKEFHNSFQAELLYALGIRSTKKIRNVLEDAVINQNYEGLRGLAEELDESPLTGDEKYLFDQACSMRLGGCGETLFETADYIAGGHDRERYMTTSEKITAIKIKDLCLRLGAKEL